MAMRYSNNKDIDRVVRSLLRQGWEYCRRHKHGKLLGPSGEHITVPGTPSDGRAVSNFRADIRRFGYAA